MNITHIKEFIAIAYIENFSHAAEELYISQSSLSKHINSLEKELGVKLFDRTTRSTQLNEYGKLLLPYAERIAAQDAAFRDSLSNKMRSDKNSIAIVTIPVMAHYGITDIIASFRKEYPEIKFQVTECEANVIDKLLASGTCELAFQRATTVDIALYDHIIFCHDDLVAILPQNHPFADLKSISLPQLRNETFLLLDENTMMDSFCVNLCKSAGFSPITVYKGHRPENIVNLVAAGVGVSLMMQKQALFYRNPGIVCLNITPTVRAPFYITHLKSRPFSPEAKLFWNYFETHR